MRRLALLKRKKERFDPVLAEMFLKFKLEVLDIMQECSD